VALNIITARLWFGDWHVTKYQFLMIVSMTVLYWVFEAIWDRRRIWNIKDSILLTFKLLLLSFCFGFFIVLLKPFIGQ